MKPGTICDFSMPHGEGRNHVAKVEVMEVRQVEIPEETDAMAIYHEGERVPVYSGSSEVKAIYICRRCNNGNIIVAWRGDLKETYRKA